MKQPGYGMLLTALNVAVVLLHLKESVPSLKISPVTFDNLQEIIDNAKSKSMNEAIRAEMFKDKDPHTIAVLKKLKSKRKRVSRS